MNILLADDSKMVRESLKQLISCHIGEPRIYEARDVKTSLECLENYVFDVIILDILLPDGTGFEVLESVKKKNMSPKVIILSNYATAKFRQKAAEKGADHFFDKSKNYKDVIQFIIDMIKKEQELGEAD
jgi:YesN/AraC family two-component response regulator